MTDTKFPTELPAEIMCWYGQWPLTWAGTWSTKRYQADAVAYVPKARFDHVESAARLGLEMAKANDLWNTAETIARALSDDDAKEYAPSRYQDVKEKRLATRIEELEAKLAKAVEAISEAIYLLDPDEEDIAKETGLYRIVTAFKELKGQNDE